MVQTTKTQIIDITSTEDIVHVRQAVRGLSGEIGLSLVDVTKAVTAASEIARNTLEYGGGGSVQLELIEHGGRRGLRMTFEDQGPGIPDLTLAMRDGYTTGGGLGLGLSGSKRLVNEFHVESEVGKGTKVVLIRWK